jgi:hypothetical protein
VWWFKFNFGRVGTYTEIEHEISLNNENNLKQKITKLSEEGYF